MEGLFRPDPRVRGGGGGIPVARYGEADLRGLRQRSGGLVLTDDYAPVENLLAPVVSAGRGALR